MIVLHSSLFLSGWVLQVLLEHEKIPFFAFYGKDGEDRTRDLTVHNLTSCLRRHCEEVDKKCYATNATRVLAFWTRFSTTARMSASTVIPSDLSPQWECSPQGVHTRSSRSRTSRTVRFLGNSKPSCACWLSAVFGAAHMHKQAIGTRNLIPGTRSCCRYMKPGTSWVSRRF